MAKRLSSIFIIICVLTFYSFTALATGSLPSFVYDRETESTKQSLIQITRPMENELVFDRYFMVCGVTDRSDVNIVVLLFNNETGKFETVNLGETGIVEVGVSGYLGQLVYLKPGTNLIRVYAYAKSQPDAYQITNHTVLVENERKIVVLFNSGSKLTDVKLTDTLKESITPSK